MLIYRLSTQEVIALSDENAASILSHATKAADHRPYVEDQEPTPTPTQRVVRGPIVVTPTEARLTWALIDKTTEEIAAEAEAAELAAEFSQLDAYLTDIQTQNAIDNTAFNAMTTNDKFVVLRTDRRVVLRTLRFLLRRARRGLA
jgi:hypothetical protein